jgi:hypothetical protein
MRIHSGSQEKTMACHARPDYFGYLSISCAEALRSRVYIGVIVAIATSGQLWRYKNIIAVIRDTSGRRPARMPGK